MVRSLSGAQCKQVVGLSSLYCCAARLLLAALLLFPDFLSSVFPLFPCKCITWGKYLFSETPSSAVSLPVKMPCDEMSPMLSVNRDVD